MKEILILEKETTREGRVKGKKKYPNHHNLKMYIVSELPFPAFLTFDASFLSLRLHTGETSFLVFSGLSHHQTKLVF